MNVVVLSGGFDPLHDGHVEMFKDAANKYDYVIVGLNSDDWLTRKKGRAFMGFGVRKTILESIQYVDQVIAFDDSDDTACDAIEYARNNYQFVTFGNGGDRKDNFPEADYCREHNVAIDDSLGGNTKLNSSSDFLAEWKFQPTDREWGLWKVLADYKTVKVKELVVTPNSNLSWQSHEKRNELWFIREGIATIYYSSDDSGKDVFVTIKSPNDTFMINKRKWHQLANETEESVSVIEIQYGDECVEHDILRAVRPTRGILPS